MTTLLLAAAMFGVPLGEPGWLVAVGGGGMPDRLPAAMLARAGGPAAVVAILPQASARPEAGEESAAFWRQAGAKSVSVVSTGAKGLEALNRATLVWMSGGDQVRLLEFLNKSGMARPVVDRLRAGAVVGGTSAGASVQGAAMPTGEEKGPAVIAGLGLWPGAYIDQHFTQRKRWHRMLDAAQGPVINLCLGIDEGTAVVWTGAKATVWGAGSVTILDARRANRRGQSVRDLTVHRLRKGEEWAP